MRQSDGDVSLLLRLGDNRIQKYGKIVKSKEVFTVLGILTAVLFFINFIPFSYADLITGLVVGTNPNGIAYGNGNMYVANGGGNFVSVVSDLTNLVIATIPVGMYPYGIAYGNGNVYVANNGGNTVSVIDSSTNSVLATVPVGTSPYGIAYGIGNVYVVNLASGSVSVISSTTNSVVATVPVGKNPAWDAFDPNNGYVYISFPYGNSISTINGVIQSPTPIPTTTSPPSISITSPTNGAVVSANTLTISGNVYASTTIQSVQVSIDGNTLNPATLTTSWSFVITLLTSGIHTITATVTDINGNTAKTSVIITIDTP